MRYVTFGIPIQVVTTVTLPIATHVNDIDHAVKTLLAEQGITAKEHVIEYAVVSSSKNTIVVEVYVVATKVAESYAQAIRQAGCIPSALVLSGHAQARALTDADKGVVLITSIGEHTTTFSVASHGIALFSTAIPFGSQQLRSLMTVATSMTDAQIATYLIETGVNDSKDPLYGPLTDALSTVVSEIQRIVVYWSEKNKNYGVELPIHSILITGSGGSMRGLAEYIFASVRIPTSTGNSWMKCLSFEEVIPALVSHDSYAYATSIGLALGSYPRFNLVPSSIKQHISDRRAFYRTFLTIGVIILALVLGFATSLLIR